MQKEEKLPSAFTATNLWVRRGRDACPPGSRRQMTTPELPHPLLCRGCPRPPQSVQTFGRKKNAVAVAHCKRSPKGQGIMKLNGACAPRAPCAPHMPPSPTGAALISPFPSIHRQVRPSSL